MHRDARSIPEILRQLESLYGNQEPCWPTAPYDFLVWWHCGYPASDTSCAKGWEKLNSEVGVEPRQLLAAGAARLARVLKAGGMVPELRAMRLMEIAARIQDEYGGDLRAGLAEPLSKVRQALKRFPNIADPGADRILLFGGMAPVPAVPSNCPHVLVRIQRGQERENYGVTYREAQGGDRSGNPKEFRRQDARLPVSQAARPDRLQTPQSRMRKLSHQLFLCFLRGKHRGRCSRLTAGPMDYRLQTTRESLAAVPSAAVDVIRNRSHLPLFFPYLANLCPSVGTL